MQEAVAQPVRAHDGDQYEDMLVAVPAELVDERHDWACDRGVLGVQYLQGTPGFQRSHWRRRLSVCPVLWSASAAATVTATTCGLMDSASEIACGSIPESSARRDWRSPGKRELGEELPETGFVLADVRIDLAVGALKVGMAHERRAAVTGTSDIEHIQVILLDDPVQVNINEILARCRTPVPDHKRFHMRQFERLFQQRIVVEVELADG